MNTRKQGAIGSLRALVITRITDSRGTAVGVKFLLPLKCFSQVSCTSTQYFLDLIST